MVVEAVPQLLRQLCDDLRLLRCRSVAERAGPGVQLRRGKRQLYENLRGFDPGLPHAPDRLDVFEDGDAHTKRPACSVGPIRP